MIVIPNLLLTGVLTVLVSLAMLAWIILFVHRKNSGLIVVRSAVVYKVKRCSIQLEGVHIWQRVDFNGDPYDPE